MSILNPELVCVDGRWYRTNPFERQKSEEDSESDSDAEPKQPKLKYADNFGEVYGTCEDEPYFDPRFAIHMPEETENGWELKVDISSAYFGYLIGKNGSTMRLCEAMSGARMSIPPMGKSGPIIIKGPDSDSVLRLWKDIANLINTVRKRMAPTHFVSIPLNSEQIKCNFEKFKSQVLEQCQTARGVDESLFQVPEKLHLTFATFPLMDAHERQLAKETLHICMEKIREDIDPISEETRIQGLNYMNDDPSEVSVLYATLKFPTIGDEVALQSTADLISKTFYELALMSQNQGMVKLHVTLMNSKFKDSSNDESENDEHEADSSKRRRFRRRPKRFTFDARPILERFKDFDFGVIGPLELHLSQRFAHGDDGYYLALAKHTLLTI